MLRGAILSAVALVVAGVGGLVTVEAQLKPDVKMKDIKKFDLAQRQFNRSIDALIRLGQVGVKDQAEQEAVMESKVSKDSIETKFVVSTKANDTRPVGRITLAGLKQLKKDVNARFDAVRKGGKMTALDQGLLKSMDLAKTRKAFEAGRGGGRPADARVIR